MSKQLDNESDEQYEERMQKELQEWQKERGVMLMAGIQSVSVSAPTGQVFFAQVPTIDLKKKKSAIIRPEINPNVMANAIKNTSLGVANGQRMQIVK